jgi:hypothetical protein
MGGLAMQNKCLLNQHMYRCPIVFISDSIGCDQAHDSPSAQMTDQ